jgi:hypothetical protein
MKNQTILYLVIGGVILYALYQQQQQQAAQQTADTIGDAGEAAQLLGSDLANLGGI